MGRRGGRGGATRSAEMGRRDRRVYGAGSAVRAAGLAKFWTRSGGSGSAADLAMLDVNPASSPVGAGFIVRPTGLLPNSCHRKRAPAHEHVWCLTLEAANAKSVLREEPVMCRTSLTFWAGPTMHAGR